MPSKWNRIRFWLILVLLVLVVLTLSGCQVISGVTDALVNMFTGLANSFRLPEFPSFR